MRFWRPATARGGKLLVAERRRLRGRGAHCRELMKGFKKRRPLSEVTTGLRWKIQTMGKSWPPAFRRLKRAIALDSILVFPAFANDVDADT